MCVYISVVISVHKTKPKPSRDACDTWTGVQTYCSLPAIVASDNGKNLNLAHLEASGSMMRLT